MEKECRLHRVQTEEEKNRRKPETESVAAEQKLLEAPSPRESKSSEVSMIAEEDGAEIMWMAIRQLGSTEGSAEVGGLKRSWHKILKSVAFLRTCSTFKILESICRFDELLGTCRASAVIEQILSKPKLLSYSHKCSQPLRKTLIEHRSLLLSPVCPIHLF